MVLGRMSVTPEDTSSMRPIDRWNLKLINLQENNLMLMTIAIVFLILWALGLVTGATLGGFVHVLLVIAIIVVLVRVIQGRRVL